MLAPGPHVTGAGSAAVRLKQLRAAFVARSQQVNMAHNRYKCLSKHNDVRPLRPHAAASLSFLAVRCVRASRSILPFSAAGLQVRRFIHLQPQLRSIWSCVALRQGLAVSAIDSCLVEYSRSPCCTSFVAGSSFYVSAARTLRVQACLTAQPHLASTADDLLAAHPDP